MTRICARWVCRLLNEDQMQSTASASKEILKSEEKMHYFFFLEGMNMTLNRHHELRFDVVGVALTAIMITGSIGIKIYLQTKYIRISQ